MRQLIVIAALIPAPLLAQTSGEEGAMVAYREKTQVVKPCRPVAGEIVVCGSRTERNARERLPLPDERNGSEGGIVRGEAPRASAARVRTGACGVEGGQGAGCVGGLSVIRGVTLMGKIATKIIDSDHEIEVDSAIPDRFKGATQP